MAAAALQARDGGTGAHCDDVVHLCDALADELGVYGHDRAELLAAGQLHDIGKVGPSQEVLDKPGPPDHHEWAQIREHTDRPYRGGRTAGAALEEVRRNTRSHQPNQPLSTGPGEFHSTSA
jgi:HD-GYP domain-containing protein (c-di-GMP phosphodiesterase class II)